jgi:enamine deaminase RidA (YjgF/YER057c/UK114 family)
MKTSDRLRELNIVLPAVAAPVGSYVPALTSGAHVLTSGQLPTRDGKLLCAGKVPDDVSIADAAEGARIAVLNALAAAAEAAGGIDNIARIIRLCVYVNSSKRFVEQPKVANGASDFLVELFGGAGRHVRSAIGVAELPLGASVELELVAEIA